MPMPPFTSRTAALFLSALALAGCSSLSGGEEQFPSGESRATVLQRQESGSILDMFGGGTSESGVLFSSNRNGGEGLAGSVNKHLWMASLETLAFLPIASTDPFTGVIATDWGSTAEKPGERFKVTAYVTDVALDPKALRVAVFREVLDERGAWIAAPVAEDTPRKIEDSILVRARQLRLEERAKG